MSLYGEPEQPEPEPEGAPAEIIIPDYAAPPEQPKAAGAAQSISSDGAAAGGVGEAGAAAGRITWSAQPLIVTVSPDLSVGADQQITAMELARLQSQLYSVTAWLCILEGLRLFVRMSENYAGDAGTGSVDWYLLPGIATNRPQSRVKFWMTHVNVFPE